MKIVIEGRSGDVSFKIESEDDEDSERLLEIILELMMEVKEQASKKV